MREWNQLPPDAQAVVRALIETDILRQDLSGFDGKKTGNHIKRNGKPTALRFDGKSVSGEVSNTQAHIFLIVKDVTTQTPLFQPRVEVKVKRPKGDEEHLLHTFEQIGIHGFRRAGDRSKGEAIIQVEFPTKIEADDIAQVLPWYVTWTTRAILGARAAFATDNRPSNDANLASNSFLKALAQAPLDDEPETPSEAAAVEVARKQLAQGEMVDDEVVRRSTQHEKRSS